MFLFQEEVKEKRFGQDSSSDRLDLSQWKHERPNLSLDFSCALKFSHDLIPKSTLENIPRASQEYIIVQELLKVFIGGESDFIQVQDISEKYGKREFIVSPCVDQLSSDFAKKCLPMVSNFSIVARFIEDNGRLHSGRVNQALADKMDEMMGDYVVFIEHLESQNRKRKLHLHELWYHIQHSSAVLKLLADIALNVSKSKTRGGSTLSLLHEHLQKMIAPFNAEVEVCRQLTTHASVPYMESIKQWIFNGIIYDPFDEFMVVADCSKNEWKKKSSSDGYWEKMYDLRPQFVPSFLEVVQLQILDAGKYLNVIRECVKSEKDMHLAKIEELEYSEEEKYIQVIINAYRHSSKTLLDYMLNEYHLMERITTAKKYFLIQQGDFVVQVLDTCNEELERNVNEVTPSRLAALVEMAIRLSATRADPFIEQFTSCLKPLDLATQVKKIFVDYDPTKAKEDSDSSVLSGLGEQSPLSGYESFMLTVKCEWPISLVFNSKVQSVYQMLFRHLFYCKYVERLLSNCWNRSQPLKGIKYDPKKPYYAAIALRHRMASFLQNMEYYMMEEAIEPAWIEFIEASKSCESIDELMKHHWNFLVKCVEDCILTKLELLAVFRQILSTCKELGFFLSELDSLKDASRFPVFPDRIKTLQEEFDKGLLQFLQTLTVLSESDCTGKVLNLFSRLNYNNFYRSMLNEANMDSLLNSYTNAMF